MDPDSHYFVLRAVVASSATGALLGAAYGSATVTNGPRTALAMGFNFGVASSLFFGLREYCITPILSSQVPSLRPKRNPFGTLDSLDDGSYRLNRVVDSSLTGALSGTTLSFAQKQRRRLGSSLFTGALIGAALQYVANEARGIRIRYIRSKRDYPSRTRSVGHSIPSASAVPIDHESSTSFSSPPNIPGDNTTPAPSSSPTVVSSPPTSGTSSESHTRTISERILDTLSYIGPIKKLTPEEFEAAKLAEEEARLKQMLKDHPEWQGRLPSALNEGEDKSRNNPKPR